MTTIKQTAGAGRAVCGGIKFRIKSDRPPTRNARGCRSSFVLPLRRSFSTCWLSAEACGPGSSPCRSAQTDCPAATSHTPNARRRRRSRSSSTPRAFGTGGAGQKTGSPGPRETGTGSTSSMRSSAVGAPRLPAMRHPADAPRRRQTMSSRTWVRRSGDMSAATSSTSTPAPASGALSSTKRSALGRTS